MPRLGKRDTDLAHRVADYFDHDEHLFKSVKMYAKKARSRLERGEPPALVREDAIEFIMKIGDTRTLAGVLHDRKFEVVNGREQPFGVLPEKVALKAAALVYDDHIVPMIARLADYEQQDRDLREQIRREMGLEDAPSGRRGRCTCTPQRRP